MAVTETLGADDQSKVIRVDVLRDPEFRGTPPDSLLSLSGPADLIPAHQVRRGVTGLLPRRTRGKT
ncbi:hypothetical protein OHV05_26850 [Kitasatospora sp. NBC_00070]|uniref:hypothetical protein n=1 Tax=Kitasatospora sp. NBC_00070 TaxID=2975962 RepID=UPI0032505FB6